MEWSKLKNIIILILLLLNGFLLVMVGGQQAQSHRFREESRAQAVQLLASNGITVEESVLPQELSLPVLTLEGEEHPVGRALALALLGEENRREESGVRAVYENASGRLEAYSTGRCTAQLAEGALPLDGQDPLQHAQALLEQAGISTRLTARQTQEDGQVLTFQQLWDGYPILNCQITLTYAGESLRHLEGIFLSAQTVSAQEEETLSIPTLLVRFLSQRNESGRMFSQILSMTPGYHFSGARPFTLTPVWYIATDTGDYQLSALDGTLL